MQFNGRVVLVTGAASGIGAAVARRFAREGASVAAIDLAQASVIELAGELHAQGARAIGLVADVKDETAVRTAVDRTVAELGRLDIMVNNAGISEQSTPIDEKSADDWHRVIETNLTGVFYGVKHAARVMKSAGRGGVIVNMASVFGLVGFKGAPAYSAAKHGILGLTQAAALELAADRIRVVAVSPGFVRTPLIAGLEEALIPLHPMGRLGEVDEVAALTAFLASDEAGFITGTHHLVDGGYTAR